MPFIKLNTQEIQVIVFRFLLFKQCLKFVIWKMNVAICIIMLLLRFEGVHESKVKRSGKHSTM